MNFIERVFASPYMSAAMFILALILVVLNLMEGDYGWAGFWIAVAIYDAYTFKRDLKRALAAPKNGD